MQVRQIRVGPMENFVYLVVDRESKEALVVDSGWETDPLTREVSELGARVKFVVATHEHFDHVATIDELAAKLGAVVVAHEASPVRCDARVADGSELSVGGERVKVLHTPGHTEDSICLYDGAEVFTGDTLFVGGIGRFAGSQAGTIFRSVERILTSLPEETTMYPGHDYGPVPFRSLKEEKMANPYVRGMDLERFTSLFS